jgi:simple sugar transport system substrate-binding protein
VERSDWKNINNPDTSAVGFVKGNLSKEASEVSISSRRTRQGLNLWTGALNLQDGSVYLKKGEKAPNSRFGTFRSFSRHEGQSVSK